MIIQSIKSQKKKFFKDIKLFLNLEVELMGMFGKLKVKYKTRCMQLRKYFQHSKIKQTHKEYTDKLIYS